MAFPALEYGPDHGDGRLRKHLASWLTTFFKPKDPITDDRIAVSGGASQNLAVLLNVFTDPSYTRRVWFVAPAYHLSFRVIQDAGFHDKFSAIPEDEEGIDIEYFKKAIKKVEDEATAQGITGPVGIPLICSCALTCFTRLVFRSLIKVIKNAKRVTDDVDRSTNQRIALGPKCTSM